MDECNLFDDVSNKTLTELNIEKEIGELPEGHFKRIPDKGVKWVTIED